MLDKVFVYLKEFATLQQSYQLLVLIVSVSFSYWLNGIYEKSIAKHSDNKDPSRLLQTIQTICRIVFPLTLSLLIFLGEFILDRLSLPTTILHIALPLFLAMAAVRLMIHFLRAALPNSQWITTGETIISALVWGTFVFYSLGWLQPILVTLDSVYILSLESIKLSILGFLKLILMLILLLLGSLWLSHQLEQHLKSVTILDKSMQVAIGKILKFVLITTALVSALSSVGIHFTSLTVFGGALGVGLGFGLQKVASNFISGFILLFDSSIKPGDVITVADTFGWVVALNARYVVVQTRDGVETLIPNETLVTSEVVNWSYSNRKVRLKLPVQISYQDDPELAMAIMVDAAKRQPRVLTFPEPLGILLGFGESGLDLQLRIWISDPESGMANIRSLINIDIWKGFKEAGISIPYPRRDITLLQHKDPT